MAGTISQPPSPSSAAPPSPPKPASVPQAPVQRPRTKSASENAPPGSAPADSVMALPVSRKPDAPGASVGSPRQVILTPPYKPSPLFNLRLGWPVTAVRTGM